MLNRVFPRCGAKCRCRLGDGRFDYSASIACHKKAISCLDVHLGVGRLLIYTIALIALLGTSLTLNTAGWGHTKGFVAAWTIVMAALPLFGLFRSFQPMEKECG